jgi:hypothetical protein
MHHSAPWLAMLANVSVGYTPQTTDIFVYCRHVGNVVPTRREHSVMSAIFLAVGVVSVRPPVANTHSYMFVGIITDEVVTYEDKKKKGNAYRLFYILSYFSSSQRIHNKQGMYSL